MTPDAKIPIPTSAPAMLRVPSIPRIPAICLIAVESSPRPAPQAVSAGMTSSHWKEPTNSASAIIRPPQSLMSAVRYFSRTTETIESAAGVPK